MLLSLLPRRSSLTLPPLRRSATKPFTTASPAAVNRTSSNAWRSDPALEERVRLIDEIIGINPSATVEFLGDFEDVMLEEYLAHLRSAQTPRGRMSRWVRPCRERGIACYENAV